MHILQNFFVFICVIKKNCYYFLCLFYKLYIMPQMLDYKIHWDDVQFVQIVLDPGESIVAEAWAMLFKDTQIEMQTNMEGWLMKWLGRVVTWESFFITSFTNKSESWKKQVSFAAPYPGKIISIDLNEIGWEFICQKDGFLCADSWTEIWIAFTKKLWAWIFWWEWFILQKLSWDWLSFIHAGWTIIKMQLEAWQSIQVDTGCIVWFTPNVDYDIKFVGWFKNALFGWEGLFLATLTWPWLVYLQSLPFSRMADRVIAASWVMWRKWEAWIGGIWDASQIIWSLWGIFWKR